MTRIFTGLVLATATFMVAAPVDAQRADPAVAAYYRAVSQGFRMPESEVLILADWGLPPEELPVVLLAARFTRVSPDALVSMRKDNEDWASILTRHSIGAGRLHIEFDGAPPAALEAAYRQFGATPRERWGEVRLSDQAIIFLVNVRFLADHTGTEPARVAAVRARSPDFPATYRALIGG